MQLRVLGTVELTAAGRTIDLGQRMERCLLGILALDLGQPVPDARLIDLLWGGAAPARPRSALQVHVSRLRKRLAPAEAFQITRRGEGYALEADPRLVDLCELRRLEAEARATAEPSARAALLARTTELTGPVLGDSATDPVIDQLRPAYDELQLTVAELRLDTALALGRHHEHLLELAELAARYPLRERLTELHMLALYRAGRRPEALDAYQRITRALTGELGLDPGQQLEALYVAILRDDPALAPPAPAAPARRDRAPAQLPPPIADFTGRLAELDQLDKLLPRDEDAPAGVVLVSTIAGTGGIGKTALALHWATRVRDRFPDGQLFVNLHGYSTAPALTPLDGLARFLRALGVPPEEVPLDVDEAAAVYRSLMAGRRMLVLLDNAASADQVRPLLPGSSGSLALVTSRDRLSGLVARDGARRLSLEVLSPAESVALLERLVGEARVAAEPEAAADLAALCGHLPLALRVTAAYLDDEPGLSLAGHAATLRSGSRLTALAVDSDDLASVRAAFDLSYEALPAPAARLFRLLGLVPGPDFAPGSAAHLAGVDPGHAVQLLDRLRAAHLVEDVGGGRYALHDLLREYAAERVSAEDTLPSLEALFGYYLSHIDAAARLLYPQILRLPDQNTAWWPADPDAPFPGAPQALAWIEAELPGLLAAIRSTKDTPLAPASWLIADGLRGYFYNSRNIVAWQAATTDALAASTAAGSPIGQAASLASSGLLHVCVGDTGQAISVYERAAACAQLAGWATGEAAIEGNLGLSHFKRNEMAASEIHHQRSLELNRSLGVRTGEAMALNNLGIVSFRKGELTQARKHCEQALEVYRELGAEGPRALPLDNLATIAIWQGRLDDAEAHGLEALAIATSIGDRAVAARAQQSLASVGMQRGDAVLASERLSTVIEFAREAGDVLFEVDALNVAAWAQLTGGHVTEAIETLRHNLRIMPATHALSRSDSKALLAMCAVQQGRHADARQYCEESLAAAEASGALLVQARVLAIHAGVILATGDTALAAREARRAVGVARAQGFPLPEAEALVVLGRAEGDPGPVREALRIYLAAGATRHAERTSEIVTELESRTRDTL